MVNPFDDPELRRQMGAAGVVYQPGMAERMMRELAPLLAAEGIDLDEPAHSIDELNAALARATEQHNLALSTPVGAQRANAVALLRRVSEAVIDGDDDLAAALIASVPPESTDARPTVAQVIGVTAGVLDEWLGRRKSASMSGTRFPAWPAPIRAAASDILTAARTNHAFDSLQNLTIRHGGRALLSGAVLAIAVVARARITREKVTLAELLPGGEEPQVADTTGFESWLVLMDAHDPSGEAEFLRSLAGAIGLDLDAPDSFDHVIEELLAGGLPVPADAIESVLEVLHDYVEYRIDTDDDPDRWASVHEYFEDDVPMGVDAEILAQAVRATEAVPEESRMSTLRATRPIGAVPILLAWLGESRAVSQTGAVRRGDVEAVARMLGIEARGVAKRPAYDEDDDTRYVTSMRELPLVDAWWEALSTTEVIEITATRVRPGRAAGDLDLDTSEMLLGTFLADLLLRQHEWWVVGYETAVWTLIGLLDEDDSVSASEALEHGWVLRMLIDCGVVAVDLDGMLSLPPALHAPVARGIVLAQSLIGIRG